jgi:hypothetical protein
VLHPEVEQAERQDHQCHGGAVSEGAPGRRAILRGQ